MLVDLAPGWKTELDRGPGWLFVKLYGPEGDGADATGLAESLCTMMLQEFKERLLLELEQVRGHAVGLGGRTASAAGRVGTARGDPAVVRDGRGARIATVRQRFLSNALRTIVTARRRSPVSIAPASRASPDYSPSGTDGQSVLQRKSALRRAYRGCLACRSLFERRRPFTNKVVFRFAERPFAERSDNGGVSGRLNDRLFPVDRGLGPIHLQLIVDLLHAFHHADHFLGDLLLIVRGDDTAQHDASRSHFDPDRDGPSNEGCREWPNQSGRRAA